MRKRSSCVQTKRSTKALFADVLTRGAVDVVPGASAHEEPTPVLLSATMGPPPLTRSSTPFDLDLECVPLEPYHVSDAVANHDTNEPCSQHFGMLSMHEMLSGDVMPASFGDASEARAGFLDVDPCGSPWEEI